MADHRLRYEVNCSILFAELPVNERAAAAKAAGFDGVEFWWPFATAVPADSEIDAFERSVRDARGRPGRPQLLRRRHAWRRSWPGDARGGQTYPRFMQRKKKSEIRR